MCSVTSVPHADPCLCFWGVLPKNDFYTCCVAECIPVRFSHRTRWGLRTQQLSALERAGLFETRVAKDTHALFCVKFTLLGYAVYTQMCAPNGWTPMLQKQDEDIWHFHGDIPLHAAVQEGDLLRVERHDIE